MTLSAFEVIDATWPARATHRAGPWLLREGAESGSRTSAASLAEPWRGEAHEAEDVALAEARMQAMGQRCLFQVRGDHPDGDDMLDAALQARGYRVMDPVVIRAAPLATLLAQPVPPLTAFPHWPPLAIQREIWEEGGIGAARVAVMERAAGPKTAILGRVDDRAAGAGYVAISGTTAMVHALHVAPEHRRKGLALGMMLGAAHWAAANGATELSLVVTRANAPANGLYASLGLEIVGQYHYRVK